ncbi:MAG: 50S ribosomal protein L4 [Desulfovibrio sp.]|uniref:50S ribosomal protein L4 n=1 Tax=Desulfovibrio sp. 7SRBS1 TaxID=3378064 RepID=UPI003B402513
MAVVKIVNQTNAEVGSIDLADEVFGVEVKPEVLNLVVRAQRAAKRAGTHAVKNRTAVSGGGSKPWRQKGTGRARAGTNRSPVWRGGGVVFGPTPRDYGFKINKKVRTLAMKMALSSRAADEKLTVVDKLELPEIKTKLVSEIAGNLGLRKALIVVSETDNTLALSARNIEGLKILEASKLNVYDILRYPQLVMLQGAVESVQERLK